MTPCAEHSVQRALCVEAALAKGAESAIAFARSRFLAELHRCSFVSSANQAPQATMVKALASKQRARKGLHVAASRARAAPSGPKSKSKSRVQVQQGAVDLFNDVEKSDLQFIMKSFEKAPQLVPWLASLMRYGVLEKTLRVKLAGDQPVQLGKKLGEKMKRFRNLPPRFWGLLWLNLWKEPPSPDNKECNITLEHHQSLAEWALRVNMSGLLPKGHKASQYEGPLLAVLKARHQQCGSKLQELTAQKFNAGAYGYFGLPSPLRRRRVSHRLRDCLEGRARGSSEDRRQLADRRQHEFRRRFGVRDLGHSAGLVRLVEAVRCAGRVRPPVARARRDFRVGERS